MPFSLVRTAALAAAMAACVSTALPAAAQNAPSGAYLAARSAELEGDYSEAARFYVRALAVDPGNAELLQGAVIAFLSLGELEKAITLARQMEAAGLRSQIAHIALMAGAVEDAAWDDIFALIEDERGIGPLVDGLLQAWAHVGNGNMGAALQSFDAVAEQQGLRGFGLYHKALALASVGDFEGADAIFSGREDGVLRSTRRGVIAHMQILSQLERNDDALLLMQDSFGTNLDPGLQDVATRLEAGEALPFSSVASPRDGMSEVFYSVAGALRGEANDSYTLLYSRVAEYLKPGHVDAILLSAGLLETMERYGLAVAAYRGVPEDDPAFHAAELGRADALRLDGRIDAAIEVLEQLSRDRPGLADVHVSLGDTLRQTENYAGAVAAYDRALEAVGTPGPRQWFVYYARGISHERLDDWARAEADFRRALELNPEQPQVLNYLGYSLVEKQTKLDEALSMIERAVAARPESGYIVDSLGWVLYRLGRYSEAVGHMERAAELMPVDPTINDHLGDVYWAVGRDLEARFQWMRALSFDPEEADADRMRAKLDKGLDAVLASEGAPPLVKVANDNN